jgi:hypothetical protein
MGLRKTRSCTLPRKALPLKEGKNMGELLGNVQHRPLAITARALNMSSSSGLSSSSDIPAMALSSSSSDSLDSWNLSDSGEEAEEELEVPSPERVKCGFFSHSLQVRECAVVYFSVSSDWYALRSRHPAGAFA